MLRHPPKLQPGSNWAIILQLPRTEAMNPTPLTDADLDRLEELLESDAFQGEAMRLDEIQAMSRFLPPSG